MYVTFKENGQEVTKRDHLYANLEIALEFHDKTFSKLNNKDLQRLNFELIQKRESNSEPTVTDVNPKTTNHLQPLTKIVPTKRKESKTIQERKKGRKIPIKELYNLNGRTILKLDPKSLFCSSDLACTFTFTVDTKQIFSFRKKVYKEEPELDIQEVYRHFEKEFQKYEKEFYLIFDENSILEKTSFLQTDPLDSGFLDRFIDRFRTSVDQFVEKFAQKYDRNLGEIKRITYQLVFQKIFVNLQNLRTNIGYNMSPPKQSFNQLGNEDDFFGITLTNNVDSPIPQFSSPRTLDELFEKDFLDQFNRYYHIFYQKYGKQHERFLKERFNSLQDLLQTKNVYLEKFQDEFLKGFTQLSGFNYDQAQQLFSQRVEEYLFSLLIIDASSLEDEDEQNYKKQKKY